MSVFVNFTCRFCGSRFGAAAASTETLIQPPCPKCHRNADGILRLPAEKQEVETKTKKQGRELRRRRKEAGVSIATAARLTGIPFLGLKAVEAGMAKASEGVEQALLNLYAAGNTARLTTTIADAAGSRQLTLDVIVNGEWLELTRVLPPEETDAAAEAAIIHALLEELKAREIRYCRAFMTFPLREAGGEQRIVPITFPPETP